MRECLEYHMVPPPQIGDLVWHYYLCSLDGPYLIVAYDVGRQLWILSGCGKPFDVAASTPQLRIPKVVVYDE